MANPLEFALTLTAIDRATRVIDGVRKGMEGVAKAGEAITRAGEAMTVAGGIASEGGEAMRRGLEAALEPAIAMQSRLAALSAATGLSADALARVREHAEAFSESASGSRTSAEEYAGVFQVAYQNLHNFAAAQDAADNAIKLSEVTGGDAASAMRTLNAMHESFGASAEKTNTVLAAAIRAFPLSADGMRQFTYAMARGAGAAQLAGGNISELAAIMGEASAMVPGGRGAQMFASLLGELPKIANKAGLDLGHGLIPVLEQIQSRIKGLAPQEQTEVLQSMGIEGSQGAMLVSLLGNLGKIEAAQKSIAGANYGVFSAMVSTWSKTAQANIHAMYNALSNLGDVIGTALLPDLIAWVQEVTSAVDWARAFFSRHQEMAAALGKVAAYLTAATVAGGALLLAFGPILVVAGQTITVLSALGPVLTAVGAAIGAIGAPAILVVGALAVAAYEIYSHWSAVEAFFSDSWREIESIFAAAGKWFKAWAPEIGEALLVGLTGPLGLIGIEIYSRWGAIESFFSDSWRGIESIFAASGGWLKAWAPEIGEAILLGIAGPFGLIGAEIYKRSGAIAAAAGRLASAARALSIGAFGAVARETAALASAVGAALDAVGAPVMRVASAVASGANEIFSQWNAVENFFSDSWRGIQSIFAAAGKWFKAWAPEIGDAIVLGFTGPFGLIAAEIYKHFDAIKAAARHVAEGIGRFFIGHSPPPEGPLHLLDRNRIPETIAESLRPAPILSAVHRLALVAALGAPLAAAAPAMAMGGAGVAPVTINVSYAPHIEAGAGPELEEQLRHHSRVLADLVAEEMAVRARRSY